MKKMTMLMLVLLAGIYHANAQKISGGIKAGVSGTTWSGDAVESLQQMLNDDSFLSLGSPKIGYHIGGFLNIPLSENVLLEPGLYYSTKGANIERSFFESSLFRINTNIQNQSHYLDLPVLFKATVGSGFQLFAGPQVSYLIDNNVQAEAGIFGISYEHDFNFDPGFRKVDFALSGGMGYQFENGLQFSAAYDHGLTTLDEGKSNFDIYNRAVKFSIGYRFK